MEKATRTKLSLSVIDGEFLSGAAVMEGEPNEMLALIVLALRNYLETVDESWVRTAAEVICKELKKFVPADTSGRRDSFLLGALVTIAAAFSIFGVVCFVGILTGKIAGRLP